MTHRYPKTGGVCWPNGTTHSHGPDRAHHARRVDGGGRRGLRGSGAGVRRAAGARLHRHGAGWTGQGHPCAPAAARRRHGDPAPADRRRVVAEAQALPELAAVPWREPTDARWLRRYGRLWHAWTLLYTVPFILAAAGMVWLDPLATPVALAAVAHA